MVYYLLRYLNELFKLLSDVGVLELEVCEILMLLRWEKVQLYYEGVFIATTPIPRSF